MKVRNSADVDWAMVVCLDLLSMRMVGGYEVAIRGEEGEEQML